LLILDYEPRNLLGLLNDFPMNKLVLIFCLAPGLAIGQESPQMVMIAPNDPIFVTVPPETPCNYALDNQLAIGPTILATWHEMDSTLGKLDNSPGPPPSEHDATFPELPRLLKENDIKFALRFCIRHPDSTIGLAAEYAYAYPAWSLIHGMFGD
jgi:hypothetical protein